MNFKLNNGKEAIFRVVKLTDDHPEILNAPASALVAELKLNLVETDHFSGTQVEGTRGTKSGVDLRRAAAKSLRQALVDLALTGRILDKGPNPGLAAQLAVGKKKSYQALQDLAAAAVRVLTPIKATFIARGYEATFLEDLAALSASLGTATARKYGGLNEQVQSTSSLELTVQKGIALMRDLDAILTPILRKTDPGLLDAWKAAVHVRSRKRAKLVNGDQGVVDSGGTGAVISNLSPSFRLDVPSALPGTGVIGGSPAGTNGGAVTP